MHLSSFPQLCLALTLLLSGTTVRAVDVRTFGAKGDGVTVGPCQVIVQSIERGADMYTPSKLLIPARYSDVKNSGLTATITFWPGARESMPCRRSTAACTKMSPSSASRVTKP